MTRVYTMATEADMEAREEELSEYTIDYLIVDGIRLFYGTVDGLTVDAVWLPKIAVGKGMRIKKWYVKVLKEGKTDWKPKEKKMKQTELMKFMRN